MVNEDYQFVDFDNHYYETLDSWTRYLDPKFKMAGRGVQIVTVGNRSFPLIGGKLSKFIPNITFDPVAAPGSLEAYFRGDAGGQRASDVATVQRLRPEYQHGEPRREILKQQGVEQAVMLPTFTCCVEEALSHDIPALHATLHAFNRWLEEEWGFSGPTVAAPLISMADVSLGLAELDRVLAAGAKVINMVPGPTRGVGDVRHSPAHPKYDPIWQRINDEGITVAYHAADSGYFRYFADYDDPAEYNAFSSQNRLGTLWAIDRPMQDMLAVMLMQKFFQRFPNVRMVSVEQGSVWLIVLLNKLAKTYRQRKNLFAEDPLETVRRHLWMCPFWEDNIPELIDRLGAGQVVFGSDWPHPEGTTEPVDFLKYMDGVDPADQRKIMRDNGQALLQLRPV